MPYLKMPDGEQIHYRGSPHLTEEQRALLTQVVEAARKQYAAEHPPADEEPAAAPVLRHIYTLGYQGSSPASVAAYVARLGAAVVDVRYSPWSPNPNWQIHALQRLLPGAYYTCPDLGNPNHRQGGPPALAHPERALPMLRAILVERPAILLCACRDWQTCHRKLAAEFLAEHLGVAVEHLPGDIGRWGEKE